jgi:glycosyltransferase involved in cell wall biosynthesis
MKILLVNTHFEDNIGGSQLQCDIIADELHQRGHGVTYLAIDKKTDYQRNYHVAGVERDSKAIAKKILEIHPDIVYWRFNKKFFYKSIKPVSRAGIKVIFAVSNIKDLQPYNVAWQGSFSFTNLVHFIRKNVLSRINHLGFNYVDALTVNNDEQIDLASINIRTYIPNAINSKKTGFNWNKPFILWVANVKDRKRPELFVELAKHFAKQDVDFLMIGEQSGNQYRWIINHDGTPDNFHYLGPKDVGEVNAALEKSLFLITTSTPEGFSNNIIQAWLQKKPVVAYEFDPGGMIEEHGLGYVTSSNFDLFVKKTHTLIQNSDLREQIGEKAYRYASEHFSTTKTADLIEDLMKELMA